MCMTCPEFAGGGDLHIWWVDANRPMCNTLTPGLKYLVHSANPPPQFKLQVLVFVRGKAYRKGGKIPNRTVQNAHNLLMRLMLRSASKGQ